MCDEICLALHNWADEERTRRMASIALQKSQTEARRDTTVNEEEVALLDNALWEAVGAGDLHAAQQAYNAGACLDLISGFRDGKCTEVIMRREDLDESTLRGHDFDQYADNHLHTLVMLAASSGHLEVINWLLDLGCDVNSSQPTNISFGDGYGYGGMTPLMCARSLQVVQLLCARGADASQCYTPPQYENRFNPIPTLAKLCRLYSKNDVEIARCLIKHGADVNEVTHECEDSGLDSYWPQVVAAGDVDFAAELLENHDADPNWPYGLRKTYTFRHVLASSLFEGDRITCVVGPTVLMMAVEKSDKAMVKLLLASGADPNLPELLPEDNCIRDRGHYDDHLSEVKEHYSLDDDCVRDGILRVPPEKKANPLSIGLLIGNAEIIELLQAAGAVAHEDSAKTACPSLFPLHCCGHDDDDD